MIQPSYSGKLIMVDGLDGSGKGVIVDTFKEHFLALGKKVLDLRELWKNGQDTPAFSDVSEYDVFVSAEPTFSSMGRIIRFEIIAHNEREYSALSTAHAFSLDREILYRKLIIPALHAGKIIVQERGVVTSLVYQPIQREALALEHVMALPGNALTLQYRPDLLILTQVEADIVMQRLHQREKKDHAIYEELSFQKKVAERYASPWLTELFSKRGTQVVLLDTNHSLLETKKCGLALLDQFFLSHTISSQN